VAKRLPFGMVSGVGRGMGVIDGGGDHRRGRAVLGVNLVKVKGKGCVLAIAPLT